MKRYLHFLTTFFRPNMLDKYMKFIVDRPLIWLATRPNYSYNRETMRPTRGARIAHFTALHFANWLSYSRLISGGISIWVGCILPSPHHTLPIILTILSIVIFALSDSLDGISARIVAPYRNTPSDWGKLLDPTMDKVATFMFFAGWLIAAAHIGGTLFTITLVIVIIRVLLEGTIAFWAGKEQSLNPQAMAGIVGKVKLGIDCLFVIGLTKFGLIFYGQSIGTALYDASLIVMIVSWVFCAFVIRHHRGNYKKLYLDARVAEQLQPLPELQLNLDL